MDHLGPVGCFARSEPARVELYPYTLCNNRRLDVVALLQLLGGVGLPCLVVLPFIRRFAQMGFAGARHSQIGMYHWIPDCPRGFGPRF
jgi:hypothetical protein